MTDHGPCPMTGHGPCPVAGPAPDTAPHQDTTTMNTARAENSTTLLLAFVTLAAFPLWGCHKAESTAEAKEIPAVSVTTTEATVIESPIRLRLTGNLRGERETDLAANVAGRVLRTQAERGQSIKQGEILAQVDIQAARLALAEAKVNVQSSETQAEINKVECERYEKLRAAGVVTDMEYDQATAKCKTAPLSLEAARARESIAAKNVGDGIIRAPFSGVVTERFVEVGEYVQASSRVVSLAQVDSLRAVFTVPEKHFPEIKLGAAVLVGVAAYQDQFFTGTVAHVSGAVQDTRDIVVEATVPNPEHKLLPGMFAEVQLTVGTQKVPSVPRSALFVQNDKDNVLVASEGRLTQRVVSTASAIGDRVPVVRGLLPGERVVASYDASLKNGTRIK